VTLPITLPIRIQDSFPLSPVLRGEGRGEGLNRYRLGPLTLTLSPEYRGEGTYLFESFWSYSLFFSLQRTHDRRELHTAQVRRNR